MTTIARGGRTRLGAFVVGGLVVLVALAFLVAPRASGAPDGLNRVAIDEGFAASETPHALGAAPTAGYEVSGIERPWVSTGLAGAVGLVVTFALAGGLTWVVARARARA